MEKNESRARVGYVDYVRVFAMVMVILLHCICDYANMEKNFGRPLWWLTGLLNEVTRTGVPLFFMISGFLLVDDEDIDYNTIGIECRHGIHNARRKEICYAGLNRWDGFKEGLCAITWMLYPDGRYFADSDGLGMEDNDEEEVYAIINTDLEIVEPFRPIEDVKAYLDELREKKREGKTNQL